MPHLKCSSTALKRFACLVMLLDHIGAACLERGLGVLPISLLHIGVIPQIGLPPEAQSLILCNTLLRSIGRLAFPIFAFFLVEGFLHTKNATRYLARLIFFGIISEPFFDLAFFGTPYYPAHQNIYATLAIGLLCMMLLHHAFGFWANDTAHPVAVGTARSNHTVTRTAQKSDTAPTKQTTSSRQITILTATFGICLLLFVAEYCHTDYGASGVLLVIMLYLLRGQKAMQSLAVVALTVDQFPASLAAVPLALYDGTRGHCAKWEQWAFYAFYPVHLLVLTLVTAWL